jgi:signal transduction histidine kinase
MLSFLAFSQEDRAVLARLHQLVAGDLAELAEQTYRQISEGPRARELLGSRQEADNMRRALAEWTSNLLTGSLDDSFLDRRSEIGRRHAQAGIPFSFMPLAMNLVRGNLLRLIADRLPDDGPTLLSATLSLNKLLDLELTVMLESYREQLTRQTRDEERLATVGQLAAGISHDLKNPLGVIKTSVMLITRRLEELPEHRELGALVGRIERGCRQAGELINQLLDFTRIKNPRSHRIPIRKLIEEALSMLDRRDAVPIEVDLEPEGLTVNGDPVDLTRVLVNLMRNAQQSVAESRTGGSIRVRVREDRGRLQIEVIDDGHGVPEILKERVFDPLVTTRSHGTGLGLAISRELIEAHGGQLSLEAREPNPGQGAHGAHGARFVIRLPLAPEPASE